MNDYSQDDAPEEAFEQPKAGKADPTRDARKKRWRRNNPAKATAATLAWRKRHAFTWREKHRQDMARRRAAAKASQSDA